MKRVISALLCIALIIALAACGKESPTPQKAEPQSYTDVYDAITACRAANPESYDMRVYNGAVNEIADAAEDAPTASITQASKDFSDTNVQVEGIDEGDIVKTDGEYIYSVFDNELRIYKADGENTVLVSKTIICDENSYVSEIYLAGDKLIAVNSEYMICYDGVYGDDVKGGYDKPKTKLLIYDVTDRTKPSYVNCIGQDGSFVSSRMYGGEIYLVSYYYLQSEISADKPETFVPCTYRNDTAEAVAADSICIMPEMSSTCYTVVTRYGIESGASENVSVLGSSDTVYMSHESLYLALCRSGEEIIREYEEDGYKVTDYKDYCETELCRIDLASMTVAATAKVPGNLESQFSMDEYNGNLRLVTTDREYCFSVYYDEKHDFTNYKSDDDGSSSTGLYILDSGLQQIAAIDGLAEDEFVRSVRFDGDYVYFCTFRQTDPLFAVNVADPKNPKILSEYKISGFSEYLHPWGEGLLFGLGMEADEETGRTEGMKLVMFDVSDKTDVKALHTMQLGDNYSEALYNHHALLISPEKGIIGFGMGESFEIFGYSAEKGFSTLAKVSFGGDWYDSRGMYIGDFAYIVSGNGVTVLDMQSFEVLTTV